MSSARQGVSEIPHICMAHGIRHVVISPGSRSAPLTLAFVSHPQFQCLSITDERSAAYYALGMAQQLHQPVALVCTSGTAVANYTPALAEALYLNIPLLVLTADRPPEWIDQNDGQTIRQQHFFPNVTKKSYQMPVDTEKESDLWFFRRTLNEAIGYCSLDNPGPVHVNIPLREPLYNPLPEVNQMPKVIKVRSGNTDLAPQDWSQLIVQWNTFPNKLVVCGFQSEHNQDLNNLLSQMAANNEIVVMAENLSNLHADSFINTPERFMASMDGIQQKAFQPDLLITLGGAVISKRLKKYLRQHKPREHWHIDEHNLFIDTFQSLEQNIRVKPELFFSKMKGQSTPNEQYSSFAQKQQKQLWARHDDFLSEATFSDLKAYEAVFSFLPNDSNLHLANSTPVRYSQLFKIHHTIRCFSNRGTSGIDGCVSTAAGAATVSGELNTLLLGDLAFIYDSNGLWNQVLPPNLRIIVFDNGGGNIFKLIETGPEVEKIRPFIETPHQVKINELCNAYGIEYLLAENSTTLKNILPDFFKPKALPLVLHIRTSGDVSANVFKQYFQHISNSNEYGQKLDNTEGIQ